MGEWMYRQWPLSRADLATFLPYFSMLSTEHLGIKIPIALSRDSLRVCLSSYFDAIAARSEADHLWDEGVVGWIEKERRPCWGRGRMHGLPSPGRHHSDIPALKGTGVRETLSVQWRKEVSGGVF